MCGVSGWGRRLLLLQSHVRLLHGVDLFPHKLHLADLCRDWTSSVCQSLFVGAQPARRLTLMLKALRLAQVSFELGSDLVEELVEAGRVAGGDGAHAAMRVHGHGWWSLRGSRHDDGRKQQPERTQSRRRALTNSSEGADWMLLRVAVGRSRAAA